MSTEPSTITIIVGTATVLDDRAQRRLTNRLKHAVRFITDRFTVEFVHEPPQLRVIDGTNQNPS